MTTSFITYNIALTPENADLIDQANALIIGAAMGASATETKPAAKKQAAKKPAAKKEEPSGPSFDDLKNAVKAAKKDHGDDFLTGVLDAFGVEKAATLPKRCASIDQSDYQAIMDNLSAGPSTETDSEDDWGEEDTGGSGDDVTAESATAAVKAYGAANDRESAKAIMVKHGAKLLSNIPDCTQAQLNAMFAELT